VFQNVETAAKRQEPPWLFRVYATEM